MELIITERLFENITRPGLARMLRVIAKGHLFNLLDSLSFRFSIADHFLLQVSAFLCSFFLRSIIADHFLSPISPCKGDAYISTEPR